MAIFYKIKESTVTTKVAVEMFFNYKGLSVLKMADEDVLSSICYNDGYLLEEVTERSDNGFKAKVVPMSTMG